MASAKDELRRLVDRLDEENAREALDYLRWSTEPTESLTDEEISRVHAGADEIARGDYTTLEELRRELGHDIRSPDQQAG